MRNHPLLIAVLVLSAPLPRLGAAEPTSNLSLWRSDLAEKIFYHGPKPYDQLVFPQVKIDSHSGAAGSSIDYESKILPHWYIEEQRGGADLIQAGVVLNNERYIDAGIKILDWGFAKQKSDGTWDCPDTFHSVSFFVEAAARATLALQESGLDKYKPKIDEWTRKLKAATDWMLRPGNLESDKFMNLLCHRNYLVAAAYGETYALTKDPRLDQMARKLAKIGTQIQWPNGVNPEKGGYDVGYQVTGLKYAFCYYCVCPDPMLKVDLKEMIRKGTDFEMTKMDENGTVTLDGSTRLGHEKNRRGKTKQIGYLPIIQALIGAELVTGDPKYAQDATLIAKSQGYW